ncbi:unnamed protein product [Rhizophagus irregularis]|uniref:Uncharacterized protein n=1 Tax=Rhizophagus irregularis TaxID=588596 RepID=A0A2I1EE33_9GLOM|nr:hypothetical protein RhiirB3_408190 [Rhizophagus irregularis]CAB4389902.1 unnamed protein product [Rhizophagus irregularis]CAB4463781.1 unnamed protein product [Rhizophagus irregularis]CAB5205675.1 unnamed protein product [Rhizophagus irregularis]CAB5389575.1 unnamed protein product [Rhizophagus irregularis]
MSSEQGTPLITRRRPQKLCPKETNNLNKIEEVIDNFHENPVKQNKVNQFSIFNVKFTPNNIPCELEEELSKILLELT